MVQALKEKELEHRTEVADSTAETEKKTDKRSRDGDSGSDNSLYEKAASSNKKIKTENPIETSKPKEENKSESEKAKIEDDKPKFVFGSTTAFGSGFFIANKPTKKLGNNTNSKQENTSTAKPFSFGSGLSFGGGFGVLKAETNDDDKDDKNNEKEEESKSEATKDVSTDSENTVDQSIVKLEKQDIKSGEESEVILYQANAKLYQLSDFKSGWKERGVGVIKINKNKETGKSRLVMRSRGLLKVILNLPLMKEFTFHKGFPGSLQSEKFMRLIAIDDNNIPVQYAFRTGSEDSAFELYDNIEKQIPK